MSPEITPKGACSTCCCPELSEHFPLYRFIYRHAAQSESDFMPRRKYGHMVKAIPPVPEDKCRYCRLGLPCPVHKKR